MTTPIRNAAMVVELGVDVCSKLMSRDDWRETLARWEDQVKRAERFVSLMLARP